MLIIKILATLCVVIQGLFMIGLTVTGFRPPKGQAIVIVAGFITVFLAIWL